MMFLPLGWILLFAVLLLAGRSLDRIQLRSSTLGYVAAAVAIGVLQRISLGRVTLDDVVFAPLLLTLPVLAGIRGGVREGASCGAVQWLALGALSLTGPTGPTRLGGEDGFIFAVMLGAITGGLAGKLRARRPIAQLVPLFGWGAFLFRDDRLWRVPSLWAGSLFAVAWCGVLLVALERLPKRATDE